MLRDLIERHHAATGSPRAAMILEHWEAALPRFYKAVPHPEKAAAPAPEKRAARAERGLKPGAATAKVEDFAGKEPVGLPIAQVEETPAPTP